MNARLEALAVLLVALGFLAVAAGRVGRVLDFRSESFRVLLEGRANCLVALFGMREVVVAIHTIAALAPAPRREAVAIYFETSGVPAVAGLVAFDFAVWCIIIIDR